MIVCICNGITDREIRKHITSGARSVSAVAKACGAGTDCGSCCCTVREMLGRHRNGGAGPTGARLAQAESPVP